VADAVVSAAPIESTINALLGFMPSPSFIVRRVAPWAPYLDG
jgi:hypothetical protein